MPVTFDNILGIHEKALHLQGKRAEVLASNLANADTPGYKARDIDFQSALKNASKGMNSAQPLHATNKGHIQPQGYFHGAELQYRQPLQDSLDGNTVEPQVEIAQYTENSMRYMASLNFVGSKLSGIITALRGE
jgi:flagellar basal-body rod protein FlgB